MFQHKYLENANETTVKQHLDFALNNVDQLLSLATPEQKDQFIKQYFVALTTLLVIFNDRQTDLDMLLGLTLDSTKLLNVLQKVSFFKEFRESPYLIEFQKNLNKSLENYPNDVTSQFLHIKPIAPVKYDKKKSRKEIAFKLFGRKTTRHQASPIQPAVRIVEYTSTPKLYNNIEHVKTDKSRFLSKLFRTTDDFQPEADKAKARAAYEKIQSTPSKSPNSIQDTVIKAAEKEKSDRLLTQKINIQRRQEAKNVETTKTPIAKLHEFNTKQYILSKIAKTNIKLHHATKQKIISLPVIQPPKTKQADYELANQQGWSLMDSILLHQDDLKPKESEIKLKKDRKIEDYNQYKEQNKSAIEKLFDKVFTKKSKPVYTQAEIEKFKQQLAKKESGEIEKILQSNIKQPISSISKSTSDDTDKKYRNNIVYKLVREIKILKNKFNDFAYRNFKYKAISIPREPETTKTQAPSAKKILVSTPINLDEEVVRKQAQDAVKAMDDQATKSEILRNLVLQAKSKPVQSTTILNEQEVKLIASDPSIMEKATQRYIKTPANQQDTSTNASTNTPQFFDRIIELFKMLFKPKLNIESKPIVKNREIIQTHKQPQMIQEEPRPNSDKGFLEKIIDQPTPSIAQIREIPHNTNDTPNNPVIIGYNPIYTKFQQIIESDNSKFADSINIIGTLTFGQWEELLSQIESKIIQTHPELFIDFSSIEDTIIDQVIKLHAKYLQDITNTLGQHSITLIKNYNSLLGYLTTKTNEISSPLAYTQSNIMLDFVISQYISFSFKRKIFGGLLGEYMIEKIYSDDDLKLNGYSEKKISHIPTKLFEVNDMVVKDINMGLDIEAIQNLENKYHNFKIMFSIHDQIPLLAQAIVDDLLERSNHNLLFIIHKELRQSIATIVAEIFLRRISFEIYTRATLGKRRQISQILKSLQQKYRQIIREFNEVGYSNTDKSGLIAEIYFNLIQIIGMHGSFTVQETDELISNVIDALNVQIIDWRIIPDTFFEVSFRKTRETEKLYPESTVAIDLTALSTETREAYQNYIETYIFAYSDLSKDMINSISSPVNYNPDYINKILAIASDKSDRIKQIISNIATKINNDINKDIEIVENIL